MAEGLGSTATATATKTMNELLSVDEAREKIVNSLTPLEPLELPIAEAQGCVLADAVLAPEDVPPFPSSAIDGFALRASDTAAASSSPVGLTVVGEASTTGAYAGRLAAGEAVRIVAGASIPEGADTVVTPDDVAVVGSSLAVGKPIPPGMHVNAAGGDVRAGTALLDAGQRIRGMDLGVLSALGMTRARVHPKPRAVVFSTGDELVDPGAVSKPGQVRDSNSYMLCGMVREAGGSPVRVGIVPEDPDKLRELFLSYLPQADLFLTTGGVGASRNHVPTVVQQLGSLDFWQVNVKPGKSLAFGNVSGRPIFGLPTNPAAAAISFELFVRSAILRMGGRRMLRRPEVVAFAHSPLINNSGCEMFIRVRTWRDEVGWRAAPVGPQDASPVSATGRTNALAAIPGDVETIPAGGEVRLILLEPLEGW